MTHTEQLGVMRFVQYTDKMQAKLVKLQQLETLWRKWKDACEQDAIIQEVLIDSDCPTDIERAAVTSQRLIEASDALEAWKP